MTLLATNDNKVICRTQLTGEGRWVSVALSLCDLASANRFLIGAERLLYEVVGVDEMAGHYGFVNWQGGVISGARYAFRALKAPIQQVCLHELRGQLGSGDVWAVSAAAALAVARLLGRPQAPLDLGGWRLEEEVHRQQATEGVSQSAKGVSSPGVVTTLLPEDYTPGVSQSAKVVGQQQLWVQLEKFAAQVHGSLNPVEVAYIAANEGRRLIECDRVSIAVRYGNKVAIEAISGADVVEKFSYLVQLMRALFDRVIAWGDKLVFTGAAGDALPADVSKALDAYLAESNSKLLVVLPLKDERDEKEGEPKKPARAALMMECFEPNAAPEQTVRPARADRPARYPGPVQRRRARPQLVVAVLEVVAARHRLCPQARRGPGRPARKELVCLPASLYRTLPDSMTERVVQRSH